VVAGVVIGDVLGLVPVEVLDQEQTGDQLAERDVSSAPVPHVAVGALVKDQHSQVPGAVQGHRPARHEQGEPPSPRPRGRDREHGPEQQRDRRSHQVRGRCERQGPFTDVGFADE
jgi:hypothetical protein